MVSAVSADEYLESGHAELPVHDDDREAAGSLVTHAVVALANAHLHEVLEHQVRVDEQKR
jgi:hypothetical protein